MTSSLAAIECGNDEGVLTEATWSRRRVYDSSEKLTKTQWATHYTYVKSKVEQEKAAVAFAAERGSTPRRRAGQPVRRPDRVEGDQRHDDAPQGHRLGRDTLKGAADLAIVHARVVEAHAHA